MEYQSALEVTKDDDWHVDYVICTCFSVAVVLVFIALSGQLAHWFLLPVTLCGIIIGVDAVRWLRGKYELFDPSGIIGLLGIHFFFTSPILVVLWEIRTPMTAVTLEDYRTWLGVMGVFNFFGLLLYQLTQRWILRLPYSHPTKVWTPKPSYAVVLVLFILIALAGQIYAFAKQGIRGVVGLTLAELEAAWGGMGISRMLATSLTILLLIFFTLLKRRHAWRQSNIITVVFFIILFTSFAFVSGGLAGSRSATVWALFWIVGITHYFWRPVSRKMVLIGLISLVFFMYLYGFYKHMGARAFEIFQRGGVEALSAESGLTIRGMLIGDLSRADVQAYMSYVLIEKPYSYRYRKGTTLVGDFLVQFPRWIFPNQYNLSGDPGKMIAGTDIMYGPGFYDPGEIFSKARFVYGLAGQAMLNFGVLSIPLAFVFWGAIVGWYRRHYLTWPKGDTRFFLAPMIVNFLFLVLTSDMDNLFSFFIFRAAVPSMAIWLMSYKSFYDVDAPMQIDAEGE